MVWVSNIRCRARIGSVAACLALMVSAVVCGDDDKSAPDAAQVAQWIRELDHTEYDVRTVATKQLAAAGAVVIEPLVKALEGGSLESRMRVVDLLGRIYSLGEQPSFETAELALEKAGRDPSGSLRSQAKSTLDSHYDVRQRLATAAIRELGGSVLFSSPNNMADDDDEEEGTESPQRPRILTAVVINQEWTGGDEGLRHVRRLTRLPVLYRVKKAPVSDEAITELLADMPSLQVQSRGPAYLGITPSFSQRGCGIGKVQAGSAAAKAGIEIHDVITHFDNQRVADFDQLIELISGKLPGDSVPMTIERQGQPLELKAELTGWPKEVAP